MDIFKYTEKDLNLNLSEIASETIRELDLACRKVSIYTSGHPLTQKALGRLRQCFDTIYQYKKYVDLYTQSGRLYVFNIQSRNSVFTEHIIDYMQVLDVKSILIDVSISPEHLAHFMSAFSSRKHTINDMNPLIGALREKNIPTVLVDSDTGQAMFEKNSRLGADVAGGYTLRNVLTNILGDDLSRLARILADEKLDAELFLRKYNFDYYPKAVVYLIPEIISSMTPSDLLKRINEIVGRDRQSDRVREFNIEKSTGESLGRLIAFHPDLEKMSGHLKDVWETVHDTPPEIKAATVEPESPAGIDQFLQEVLMGEISGHQPEDFGQMYERLLRTGQKQRAANLIDILLASLAGENFTQRERSLFLLKQVLRSSRALSSKDLIDSLITKIDEYLTRKKETFEFSDLIWEIAKTSLQFKDGSTLGRICDILQKHKNRQDAITIYESAAVRKALEEMNRPEVINTLIHDLINGTPEWYPYVKAVLTAIGSEEAAYALSGIISHESRQVRLQVLKILAEMGKASLNVCMNILKNSKYFERPHDRRELPEENWYIVRNALFVLGALKDQEACKAIGMRLSDEDYRVRRAIVSALETIGGEASADLLLLLADDPDREIRESAIIGLGLIRVPDIVPELIEYAERRNTEILNIITTLGKLGGEEARRFLGKLLGDNQFLAKFCNSRSSRDDIRLSAIKALGRTGDIMAVNILKEFRKNLSATSKILLGGSKLDRAVNDALSNIDK